MEHTCETIKEIGDFRIRMRKMDNLASGESILLTAGIFVGVCVGAFHFISYVFDVILKVGTGAVVEFFIVKVLISLFFAVVVTVVIIGNEVLEKIGPFERIFAPINGCEIKLEGRDNDGTTHQFDYHIVTFTGNSKADGRAVATIIAEMETLATALDKTKQKKREAELNQNLTKEQLEAKRIAEYQEIKTIALNQQIQMHMNNQNILEKD